MDGSLKALSKQSGKNGVNFPKQLSHTPCGLTFEKHDDKKEEYTLGIMRNTIEHEANRGLLILKNKSQALTEGEMQNDVHSTSNESNEPDEYAKYYI
jgi:hypothetical protein